MKLDQDELALRMLEAATSMKRPDGLVPTEVLGNVNPQIVGGWQRAAVAAILYFTECAGPLDALPKPREPMASDRTNIIELRKLNDRGG